MFNALAVEKDAASGGTAASVKQPALEHLPDTEKRPLESETWAGCVEAVGVSNAGARRRPSQGAGQGPRRCRCQRLSLPLPPVIGLRFRGGRC